MSELFAIVKELGTMGILLYVLWKVVPWHLRQIKAKRNDNGARRRATDSNPGNPDIAFEKIDERCALHSERINRLSERFDQHSTEVRAELRELDRRWSDQFAEFGQRIATLEGQQKD